MFTKTSDFLTEWKQETAITQRLLDALTDESLKQEVAPGYRTLGQLAWHITWSFSYLKDLGLNVSKPAGEETAPESAAFIASEYFRLSAELLQAVESEWPDEVLGQTVNLFGQDWHLGKTLRFVIQHEVHHRGQLTNLMRQAGLSVPGVYGPTRDEWIEKGKKPLL